MTPGPGFGPHVAARVVEPSPGVRRRSLVRSERLHLIEFEVPRGTGVPRHAHRHEQVGYVVSGRLAFTIGGETRELGPGDAYAIAGGVEHESRAIEDTVVIDVFDPIREDYL